MLRKWSKFPRVVILDRDSNKGGSSEVQELYKMLKQVGHVKYYNMYNQKILVLSNTG